MFFRRRKLMPLADRGPLHVMFVATSLPIGGAETLLVDLVRRMDRTRFLPELCCLKRFDALGETLAAEIPSHAGLLAGKYDATVLWRLVRLMRRRRIDAVVTVGPGDKMFWGRLAARLAGVPVVCSALHSSGLPDRVEAPNRLLAPLTDAFIAVAETHGRHLAAREGCPARKVRVVPNGVDVERFHPRWPDRELQSELKLEPGAPTVGIIAALRPEKNHELFLYVAALVHVELPATRFLVVGDGPQRAKLERLARSLGLADAVRFLGARRDVPELLALMDVVALTSKMESNPICLLEAMAAEKPVVATKVGSVAESVQDGRTGYLTAADDSRAMADRILELLRDRPRASSMGRAGREEIIARWSVERMVRGYEELIADLYARKCAKKGLGSTGRVSEGGGREPMTSEQFSETDRRS
ncbi:MAG: glycosyltransferase [Pirellulales bacterium]|nr:glycosyltransferase [Pirellulales bacterium]